VWTVAAALREGLVDDVHVAVVPVLLRAGERLYDDLGTWPDGSTRVETAAGEGARHVRFARPA